MRLAIFDLDGTLYDTSDVNYHAYNKALSRYNTKLDYDFFKKECNGKVYKTFIPQLLNDDLEKTEDVHIIKKTVYKDFIHKAVKNKLLFEILKNLKAGGYKIALATMASRENAMELLIQTKEVDSFDLILCSDNVTHPKPDPEIFKMAMEYFDAKPHETIIFEDSKDGLSAARKTGVAVFRVDQF